MDTLSFTFSVISFIFQLLIINYLFKLEKNGCMCAMDYKRTYIFFYLVINTIFVIVNLSTNVYKHAKNNRFYSLLLNIYSGAGILNIAFIIKYVNMLKNKKCSCSKSFYRDLLYINSIIDAIIFGFSILLVSYIILFSPII